MKNFTTGYYITQLKRATISANAQTTKVQATHAKRQKYK